MNEQTIRTTPCEKGEASPLVRKYEYLFSADDTPCQALRDAFPLMKDETREQLLLKLRDAERA